MLEDVIGSLSQKVVERDAEIALLRSRLAQREKELLEAREIIRDLLEMVDDAATYMTFSSNNNQARARAFLKKAGD